MKFSWVALTLLGAAALAAGCNNNTYNNTPGQCNPNSGVSVAMVYPAPNSTGIPDNFSYVVLGSSSALPNNFAVAIANNTTGNGLFAFNGVGAPPSPIPTPFATPAFANPVYQASGNPGISFVAGSQLTVYFNNLTSNCVATLNLGSFRVQ